MCVSLGKGNKHPSEEQAPRRHTGLQEWPQESAKQKISQYFILSLSIRKSLTNSYQGQRKTLQVQFYGHF